MYRYTHKKWDFIDDLKLFRSNNLRAELWLLPQTKSGYDILGKERNQFIAVGNHPL